MFVPIRLTTCPLTACLCSTATGKSSRNLLEMQQGAEWVPPEPGCSQLLHEEVLPSWHLHSHWRECAAVWVGFFGRAAPTLTGPMCGLWSVCGCRVPPLPGPGDAGVPLRSHADPAEPRQGAAAAAGHRVGAGPGLGQRQPAAGAQQHLLHAPTLLLPAPRWRPGLLRLERCTSSTQANSCRHLVLFFLSDCPDLRGDRRVRGAIWTGDQIQADSVQAEGRVRGYGWGTRKIS